MALPTDETRTLNVPLGVFLSPIIDEPLPNLVGFDRLKDGGDPEQIRRLCEWVEPQEQCDAIRRFHGDEGLSRVLRGIAEACAAKNVPMGPRVRSVAGWWGVPVV